MTHWLLLPLVLTVALALYAPAMIFILPILLVVAAPLVLFVALIYDLFFRKPWVRRIPEGHE